MRKINFNEKFGLGDIAQLKTRNLYKVTENQ